MLVRRQQQDYISLTSLGQSLWSLLVSIEICKKIWTTLLSLYTSFKELLLINYILPYSKPSHNTPSFGVRIVKSSKSGFNLIRGLEVVHLDTIWLCKHYTTLIGVSRT